MPDWKVLSGLSIFLFCATAFGLFMLDPQISAALDRWQTLATGFLAIGAALIAFFGAVYAARLQADSIRHAAETERSSAKYIHDCKLREDMRRVAATILVELANAEIILRVALENPDILKKVALAYDVKGVEDTIITYDPRRVLARPIFDSLVSQIGILGTDTAEQVLQAYHCIADVCRRPDEPENQTYAGGAMKAFELFIKQLRFAHSKTKQAIKALQTELNRNPLIDLSSQTAS